MIIIFLGTASCNPTEYRGVSSLAIRFDSGDVWMVDCGEGTQVQLQKSSVRPSKIKKVFITHLHGDHLFGLPGFLCTMSTLAPDRMDFTLELYGPRGLARFVRESLNLSRSPLSFKYQVFELIPMNTQYPGKLYNEWPVKETDETQFHPQELPTVQIAADVNTVWNLIDKHEEVTVKASRIEHRIPCFGYVFTENDKVGTLDAEYLKKLGVPPGPMYAELKRGLPVTLPNGTTIDPKSCVGPAKKGKKITVLGDTSNPDHMTKIAMDSTVLIHEATLEDGLKQKAIANGHSTPSMAVAFSHKILASTLILNHYSQRYKAPGAPGARAFAQTSSTEVLLKEAQAALEKYSGYNCEVITSRDLMEHIVK